MNFRTLAVSFFVLLPLAPTALAQGVPPAGAGDIIPPAGIGNPPAAPGGGTVVTLVNPLGTSCNSTNTDCLGNFLGSILDFVIRIGAIVVILMLVYVGYLFVVAQGNDAKITAARSALLWTVVGALILLGAKAIQVAITATVKAISAGT
jgi:hypothetical protein